MATLNVYAHKLTLNTPIPIDDKFVLESPFQYLNISNKCFNVVNEGELITCEDKIVINDTKNKRVIKIVECKTKTDICNIAKEVLLTKILTSRGITNANTLIPVDGYDMFILSDSFDIGYIENKDIREYIEKTRLSKSVLFGFVLSGFEYDSDITTMLDQTPVSNMYRIGNENDITAFEVEFNKMTNVIKRVIWDHASKFKVSHNDLHGRNILLSSEGEIDIIDFERCEFIDDCEVMDCYVKNVQFFAGAYFFKSNSSDTFECEKRYCDNIYPEYRYLVRLYNQSNLQMKYLNVEPSEGTPKPDVKKMLDILSNY